ncbi:MAG: helix-turn-helix transcriptional regulator [Acidimicrobiales bacterium]
MSGRRGPRPTQQRLHHLLAILPWLMERGGATVDEVAERFGMRPEHVVADLEVASMCGLPPYIDEMIDIYVEDGRVHVGVPRLFRRPLRLTAQEAFSVVAAAHAALALPGADPDGPLARALRKLEAVLGARAVVSVAVERPALLDVVTDAVERGERLAVVYRSGDDRRTERLITPRAVLVREGAWYVVAECALAQARRTFRVDRMEAAEPTGERVEVEPIEPLTDGWFDDVELPEAELVLSSEAAWVAGRYPVRSVEALGGGRLRVRLPVTSERWLGRLLVQLGPDAEVVAPERWCDLGVRTATSVLAAYR